MPTGNRRPACEMSAAARDRVATEMGAGQDATDPQFLFSVTTTTLLLAISGGLINPVGLAKRELANRGLNQDGSWVGFSRAREVHLGASTVSNNAASHTAAETAATEIARIHLKLDTLDTRHNDSLDFHDLAVWSIREALIAAFESGARSTRDATNGQ